MINKLPQVKKPVSHSLFNYLKALKNQRNVKLVKIKAKEIKDASSQSICKPGVFKLESDHKLISERFK